jgi:hypothetical protein
MHETGGSPTGKCPWEGSSIGRGTGLQNLPRLCQLMSPSVDKALIMLGLQALTPH